MSTSSAFWYLTRGSGFVTTVLLTLSVVLGIVTTLRVRTPRWPRFASRNLHRNVSLLVVVFLGIHVATAILDAYAPIGWLDAIIPFRSPYRPLWLGLGAVALDLLAALTVTSLVRHRMPFSVWRAIHWTAYACWPVALLHGLGTGTDTKLGWVLFVNLACLAAVVAALGWRLVADHDAPPRRRAAAGAAGVAVPVLVLVWLVMEPLQPGWARKAGTPASLLGGGTAVAAAAPVDSPTAAAQSQSGSSNQSPSDVDLAAEAFSTPFSGRFSGTASTVGGTQDPTTVVIDGTLVDGLSGQIHLELRTTAGFRGETEISGGTVHLGTAKHPTLFSGTATTGPRRQLLLSLTGPEGRRLDIVARVRFDEEDGSAAGLLDSVDQTAQPARPTGDEG